MKTVYEERKVKVRGGRIVGATVLEDGTCKLTVEFNGYKKHEIITENNVFALVEASGLSLNDKFMKWKVTTSNQWELKKSLMEAIESGLSDFWRPRLDPSFNEDKTGLVFEVGKKPAVGKAYNWWEEKAWQYLPERGSRLGTRNEYVAFLGVLIKKLIVSGWPVDSAWEAVCDDSRKLGHYWDSMDAKHTYELTGSSEVFGFRDLGNTAKILALNKETGNYWLAGGTYAHKGHFAPLAFMRYCTDLLKDYSTGWIVLSK